MNIFDIDALNKLCGELEKRIGLLKSISDSYAKALDLMEKQEYEALPEELESQNNRYDELSKQGLSVPLSELAAIRDKAASQLARYKKNDRLAVALKKTVECIELYGRLIKNCKALSEKLAFLVSEKKTESERHISAAKTRKQISTTYGASGYGAAGHGTRVGPAKGTHVDYKSTR